MSQQRPQEHYFTQKPIAKGARQIIETELRGFSIRLVTERGVFSRARVDRGTRLLIKHLAVGPEDHILDLGCGYGIVGVAAGLLAPQGRVTLVDINERAAELARENLRLNGIGNGEVLQGDGFTPVQGRKFDIIALNPPIRAGFEMIEKLIEQSLYYLEDGGSFYLVGRTKQGVVRLAERMVATYGNVEEIAKGGGFRLFLAHRRLT